MDEITIQHISFTNQLTKLFLQTVIPLVATIVVERVIIFSIAQSTTFRSWVKKQVYLQPNYISKARSIMGFVGILIYHFINEPFALYWCGFWIITDMTDGSLARYLDRKSTTGEIIDPLSDKLLYTPLLLYAAIYLNILSTSLVIFFLIIDFTGQYLRKFTKIKVANFFGKSKTLFCILTSIIIYFQQVYFRTQIIDIGNISLVATIILSIFSIFFRVVPNSWYANILSILNMVCGTITIVLIISGVRLEYAFMLIFIAQLLDMIDGHAAKKWGSTPKGELLDNVADGTSFGLAISIMLIFSLFNNGQLSVIFTAIFYMACTIIRLFKYSKYKKSPIFKLGAPVFRGLPSPAAALFVGSYIILIDYTCKFEICLKYEWLKVVPIIFISILMISNIKYIHIGNVIMTKIPNIIKSITYYFFIIFLLISIQSNTLQYLMMSLLVVSTLYIFFGSLMFLSKIK